MNVGSSPLEPSADAPGVPPVGDREGGPLSRERVLQNGTDDCGEVEGAG